MGIYDEVSGTWGWSDTSSWIYSQWASGNGTYTPGQDCVYLYNEEDLFSDDEGVKEFHTEPCAEQKEFVCQTNVLRLKERANFTLTFSQEQISFSSITVRYEYVVSQQLDNPRNRQQMTGFRLTWFIRDHNGNRVTKEKQVNNQEWKPVEPAVPAPKYENPWLVRMVELARQARLQNISTEALVERALRNVKFSNGKIYREIEKNNATYTFSCIDGHLNEEYFEQFFAKEERAIEPRIENVTSFQDVYFHSGTKIFVALTYCPHSLSLKLLTFFQGLVNSPSVLIRTVVDTIQSGNSSGTTDEDRVSKKGLNNLYLTLEKKFSLQYGKVLLGLLSKNEIELMINKDWPFFATYSQELELCLNETTCRDLNGIIATPGKYILN